MSRFSTLLISMIWIVLGAILVLLSTSLFVGFQLPCLSNQEICTQSRDFLVHTLLNGQVWGDSVDKLLFVIPVFLFMFALLCLFAGQRLFRFFLDQEHIYTIPIIFSLNAFIILIVIITNSGISASLFDHPTMVNYREGLGAFRLASVLIVSLLGFLSLFLFFLPVSPPSPLRVAYLQKPNQCLQCGLMDEDERPQCILCKQYFQIEVSLSGTFRPEEDIAANVRLKPAALGKTVHSPEVQIVFNPAFQYVTHTPSLWHSHLESRRSKGNILRLSGPDYLRGENDITIQFQALPVTKQQRQRETTYQFKIEARSDQGSGGEPQTAEVKVARDATWLEQVMIRGRALMQTGLQSVGKQTKYGVIMGGERVLQGMKTLWRRLRSGRG